MTANGKKYVKEKGRPTIQTSIKVLINGSQLENILSSEREGYHEAAGNQFIVGQSANQ